MTKPDVSVVMAVHNGAPELARTLESVLRQESVELELVVVDDGSTDESREVLDTFARRDARIRTIEVAHGGLTSALRIGCGAASGRLIARQDCGDLSLPGRLAAQARALDAEPLAVMVSAATRFVGPERELLYEVSQSAEEAERGLRARSLAAVRGPSCHGCTMFRRDVYERVGGYREPFRVAQDLDLWLRLAERGRVLALPEVLYEATIAFDSISSRARASQIASAKLALECAAQRDRGADEGDSLQAAAALPVATRDDAASRGAAALFVAGCLRRRDPRAARKYYAMTIRNAPFEARGWLGWLVTLLAGR